MSDIISARCFGCGHTIKVPAGLGGKKARCPQCTNTITIPNPNDTQYEEIVSDADLPEVAVDGQKFVPEEGDAPHPDAVVETPVEDPSEARRRNSGTGFRRAVRESTSSSHPRVQRSGTQPRYTGQGAPAAKKPAAPASNQGMVVGIVLGVVALLIIAFVVANKGGSSKTPPPTKSSKDREKEREATTKAPQYSPEDQALISRTMDYAAAVNRGDAGQVFRFYTYDPEEERKVRIRATELVDQKVSYDNPQVSSVNSASGTITFTHSGGKQKSLQWKQVDNVWMIAEKPSP
ncbi:MAG TPA: hypothetical protein VKW04_04875 [Planctomycetota bacterium]|nr:hypothetical protein [Planctomycetota bacterium]